MKSSKSGNKIDENSHEIAPQSNIPNSETASRALKGGIPGWNWQNSFLVKVWKQIATAFVIYAILYLIINIALNSFSYTSDSLTDPIKEASDEVKMKEYELHINLYQYYLRLGYDAVTFFYLISGGILAYILKNETEKTETVPIFGWKVPILKLSLLLPILFSNVFGGIFIYGAARWHVVKESIGILRDDLGIKRMPDLQILLQMLNFFGWIFYLVGFLLLVFFFLDKDTFKNKND